MEDQASTISKKNLEEGFVQIPKSVLINPNLSASLKVVYAVLLLFMQGKGYCYPSHKKIGEYIGKSRFSVMKYLNQLENLKLIRATYRGNKRTNTYYQNDISTISVVANLNSGVATLPQGNVANLQHQYVAELPHKVYEANNINTKYKKTINRDKNGKFKKIILGQFNKEAELLAKELKDEKNIKFFLSLEYKIKTGLINFRQILNALQVVKDKLRIDQADGNDFWQNPPAMFNDQISKILGQNKINRNFIPDFGVDIFTKSKVEPANFQNTIQELSNSKMVEKEKSYFEKQQELNSKRNKLLDDLAKIKDED